MKDKDVYGVPGIGREIERVGSGLVRAEGWLCEDPPCV